MTLEETNNCEIIDELIRQGRSFAMYRNPGEEEPHFLMQTCGEVHLIRKMEDLNGRTGFVIAPFRVTPQCPIILIRPDCHEIPSCAGNLHTPAQGDDAASYGQQLVHCFLVLLIRLLLRQCHRKIWVRYALFKYNFFQLFYDIRMLECYIVVFVNICL